MNAVILVTKCFVAHNFPFTKELKCFPCSNILNNALPLYVDEMLMAETALQCGEGEQEGNYSLAFHCP